MGRVLGLPLLAISLALGAYLYSAHARTQGPAAPTVTQAETQADAAVAATNFQGADVSLQAWFAANATYAGATLPPGSGVVLVRADTTGYCLQSGTDEHETGPGGQPQPGPC